MRGHLGGWRRSQTRHTPVDHRERVRQLEDLLRSVLESYEDTLSFHTAAEAEYGGGQVVYAGSCPSCATDLEILRRRARELGVEVEER